MIFLFDMESVEAVHLPGFALRVDVSLCFTMPIQIWGGLHALDHAADVAHHMIVALAGPILTTSPVSTKKAYRLHPADPARRPWLVVSAPCQRGRLTWVVRGQG